MSVLFVSGLCGKSRKADGMPENASSSLDVGMVHFYSCVIAIICWLVVNNAIGRDLRLVV